MWSSDTRPSGLKNHGGFYLNNQRSHFTAHITQLTQEELPTFIGLGNDGNRNSLYGLKISSFSNLEGQRRKEPDSRQWTHRKYHGKINLEAIVRSTAKAVFQIAPITSNQSDTIQVPGKCLFCLSYSVSKLYELVLVSYLLQVSWDLSERLKLPLWKSGFSHCPALSHIL